MANLKDIVYCTEEQLDVMASGTPVGDHEYNENDLYLNPLGEDIILGAEGSNTVINRNNELIVDLSSKQDTLVSGTNIKTINGESVLGSGDIEIKGGSDVNVPYSLLDCKWSDHEISNLSWLRSNGQWNSGTIYVSVYELLVKLYNGTETIEGITVKALGDSTINDYDFVIDTANTQFKLPIKTNLASGKIKDVIPVLTGDNGTLSRFLLYKSNGDGPGHHADLSVNSSGGVAYSDGTITQAGQQAYSKLYADGQNAVEETGLYLYYYVGETVQNANLIDAGRIQEQLADKVDINSSWGFPTERYIDLTLGATGTAYTAPANGYFYLRKSSGAADKYISMISGGVQTILYSNGTSDQLRVWLPIKKGADCYVGYNATGTTHDFKFVYAEGEE